MARNKNFSSRTAAATVQDGEPEKTDVLDQVSGNQSEEQGVESKSESDDASVAFQKQIEALRKSEQTQRDRAEQLTRDREDAIKRANEREVEIHRLKKTTVESQVEAVSAALAAAAAEAETAQRDIEKSLELGDFKGQADAYRRLSKAEANIARLEDGKVALEHQAKVAAEAKIESPKDPLDGFNLPPLAKDWLRAHPSFLTDGRKNAKIQSLHWDVMDEGHEPYSASYFESLESHLGLRKTKEQFVEEDDDQPRTRSSMVSAPVSRDAPLSSSGERPGRITLTVAQKEAAKIAGISEKDYAENVIRLKNEKLNGNYGGAP